MVYHSNAADILDRLELLGGSMLAGEEMIVLRATVRKHGALSGKS